MYMADNKLFKKAHQLKLASMSIHWNGMPPVKSGKHNSQIVQRIKKRARQKAKNL